MSRTTRLACSCIIAAVLLAACTSDRDAPAQPNPTPSPVATSVPTSAPAADTGAGIVEAEAVRDEVKVKQGGAETILPSSTQPVPLAVGDGVTVDALGKALLSFGLLLKVNVYRDGDVTYESYSSVFARLKERLGTILANTSPQGAGEPVTIDIDTEYAIIQISGTQLLVSRESNTPLEWVITLDAPTDDDVTVASKAEPVTKAVPAGIARWVAPIGEAGPEVPYDRAAVDQWLLQLDAGEPVPEIGRVLWPAADLSATTQPLKALPPPGDPFSLEGVTLTLKSGTYELGDCNGDGIDDVVMKDGVLQMDFRGILARVGYLETDVINRIAAGTGSLTVFNPGYEEIDFDSLAAVPGPATLQLDADQPLNLPSDQLPGQPFHFAELALSDGCFVRFGTAPTPTPELTPTPTPEPTPTLEPQTEVPEICLVTVNGLFLRSEPSQTSRAIGMVLRGARLTTVSRSADGWLAVQAADGREGWVSANLVNCEVTTLPTVGPPLSCVRRQPADWGSYRVRPGDTLWGIAARSCSTATRLAEVNCLVPGRLSAGDVLFVPRCPTVTPPPTPIVIIPSATPIVTVCPPEPKGSAELRGYACSTPTVMVCPPESKGSAELRGYVCSTPTATATPSPSSTPTPTATATPVKIGMLR